MGHLNLKNNSILINAPRNGEARLAQCNVKKDMIIEDKIGGIYELERKVC